MGGSPDRAASFAEELRKTFDPTSPGPPSPIGKTERFSIFKVGPIMSVSH